MVCSAIIYSGTIVVPSSLFRQLVIAIILATAATITTIIQPVAAATNYYTCSGSPRTLSLSNTFIDDAIVYQASNCEITIDNVVARRLNFSDTVLSDVKVSVSNLHCNDPLTYDCIIFEGGILGAATTDIALQNISHDVSTTASGITNFLIRVERQIYSGDRFLIRNVTHNVAHNSAGSITIATVKFDAPISNVRELVIDGVTLTSDQTTSVSNAIAYAVYFAATVSSVTDGLFISNIKSHGTYAVTGTHIFAIAVHFNDAISSITGAGLKVSGVDQSVTGSAAGSVYCYCVNFVQTVSTVSTLEVSDVSLSGGTITSVAGSAGVMATMRMLWGLSDIGNVKLHRFTLSGVSYSSTTSTSELFGVYQNGGTNSNIGGDGIVVENMTMRSCTLNTNGFFRVAAFRSFAAGTDVASYTLRNVVYDALSFTSTAGLGQLYGFNLFGAQLRVTRFVFDGFDVSSSVVCVGTSILMYGTQLVATVSPMTDTNEIRYSGFRVFGSFTATTTSVTHHALGIFTGTGVVTMTTGIVANNNTVGGIITAQTSVQQQMLRLQSTMTDVNVIAFANSTLTIEVTASTSFAVTGLLYNSAPLTGFGAVTFTDSHIISPMVSAATSCRVVIWYENGVVSNGNEISIRRSVVQVKGVSSGDFVQTLHMFALLGIEKVKVLDFSECTHRVDIAASNYATISTAYLFGQLYDIDFITFNRNSLDARAYTDTGEVYYSSSLVGKPLSLVKRFTVEHLLMNGTMNSRSRLEVAASSFWYAVGSCDEMLWRNVTITSERFESRSGVSETTVGVTRFDDVVSNITTMLWQDINIAVYSETTSPAGAQHYATANFVKGISGDSGLLMGNITVINVVASFTSSASAGGTSAAILRIPDAASLSSLGDTGRIDLITISDATLRVTIASVDAVAPSVYGLDAGAFVFGRRSTVVERMVVFVSLEQLNNDKLSASLLKLSNNVTASAATATSATIPPRLRLADSTLAVGNNGTAAATALSPKQLSLVVVSNSSSDNQLAASNNIAATILNNRVVFFTPSGTSCLPATCSFLRFEAGAVSQGNWSATFNSIDASSVVGGGGFTGSGAVAGSSAVAVGDTPLAFSDTVDTRFFLEHNTLQQSVILAGTNAFLYPKASNVVPNVTKSTWEIACNNWPRLQDRMFQLAAVTAGAAVSLTCVTQSRSEVSVSQSLNVSRSVYTASLSQSATISQSHNATISHNATLSRERTITPPNETSTTTPTTTTTTTTTTTSGTTVSGTTATTTGTTATTVSGATTTTSAATATGATSSATTVSGATATTSTTVAATTSTPLSPTATTDPDFNSSTATDAPIGQPWPNSGVPKGVGPLLQTTVALTIISETPQLATMGVRTAIILISRNCGQKLEELDISMNPTRMVIGEDNDAYRWWNGAVVGDAILLVGAFCCFIVGLYIYRRCTSKAGGFRMVFVLARAWTGTLWQIMSSPIIVGSVASTSYSDHSEHNTFIASLLLGCAVTFICTVIWPLVIIQRVSDQLQLQVDDEHSNSAGAADAADVPLVSTGSGGDTAAEAAAQSTNNNRSNNGGVRRTSLDKKHDPAPPAESAIKRLLAYLFEPREGLSWKPRPKPAKKQQEQQNNESSGGLYEDVNITLRASWGYVFEHAKLFQVTCELLCGFAINLTAATMQTSQASVSQCRVRTIVLFIFHAIPTCLALWQLPYLARFDTASMTCAWTGNTVAALCLMLSMHDIDGAASFDEALQIIGLVVIIFCLLCTLISAYGTLMNAKEAFRISEATIARSTTVDQPAAQEDGLVAAPDAELRAIGSIADISRDLSINHGISGRNNSGSGAVTFAPDVVEGNNEQQQHLDGIPLVSSRRGSEYQLDDLVGGRHDLSDVTGRRDSSGVQQSLHLPSTSQDSDVSL